MSVGLSPHSQGFALAERLQDLAAAHESWRGRTTLNLNAASNVMSPAARASLSGRLADKGVAGTVGRRRHPGAQLVDQIEAQIEAVALNLYGAEAAELRAPSGNLANGIAFAAFLEPGDTVLALPAGVAHQSHRDDGWPGRLGATVADLPYDFDRMDVDLDAAAEVVRRTKPRLIVVGSQFLLFPYRLRELRMLADTVGAVVVYDAAHVLGLIAGRTFQDPLREGAHVVTGSTQKSLPGPVGGLILSANRELGDRVSAAASTFVSNYQNNRVLSLGITLTEMLAFGSDYADACVRNAQALSAALARRGLEPHCPERGWTRSSQILLDLGASDHAAQITHRWEQSAIMTTPVLMQLKAPPSIAIGARLGVQEVTRLGMGPDEMEVIADLITGTPTAETVTALVQSFPDVQYCFTPPSGAGS
jgi:glycine hydroxymethyltransferase